MCVCESECDWRRGKDLKLQSCVNVFLRKEERVEFEVGFWLSVTQADFKANPQKMTAAMNSRISAAKSDIRLRMPFWLRAFRFNVADKRGTHTIMLHPHAHSAWSFRDVTISLSRRWILCVIQADLVCTKASEELGLWRQSPAHIFAGLNLSGCTLYK